MTTGLLAVQALARPGPEANLLANGTFDAVQGGSVYRWMFPPSPLKACGADAAQVERGVDKDATGNAVLFIATTKPMKAHVWWQQEVAAEGGATYTLSVRMAAAVREADGERNYASPDIGIYFLDANGHWLGFERVPPPCDFSPEWKTVSMKVTAPDNAAKIGVRLGIDVSAETKARFDDAVLTVAP